jgi:hypothetical protein
MTSLLKLIPAGSVICYPASSIPAGWLLCSGGSYSATQYPSLFNAVRYKYGGQNDSFNVPDLADQFIRGASASSDVGERQDDLLKTHQHSSASADDTETQFIVGYAQTMGVEGIEEGGGLLNKPNLRAITIDTDINNMDPEIYDENETRPANIAFAYIIKY